MNKLLSVSVLLILISLTGCAEMNSKFDCPLRPGVSCESLDQINAHVDHGEIGHGVSMLSSHQPVEHVVLHQAPLIMPATLHDLRVRKPLRYGESVMRIWIAPYEDTSGNYHLASEIYTVVKPGHWIGEPLKEITRIEK